MLLDMRISFSTATFYARSLAYSLRLARDAGFDGVELALGVGYQLTGPQHYLRLNAHPGEAQTAHVALDTATDGSTQILLGLADALVNDALAKQRAQLHGILKSH